MSGRLTILPKKSYCPWKPENVERVLRDERLEREKHAARAEAERRGSRRREGDAATADGHVNLFPEAREAELRRAGGRGSGAAAPRDASGVPPVPLGGDEAARRRLGVVPFYGRPRRTGDEGKYDDAAGSRRLGARRGGRGAAAADDITRGITRDQYETREERRKRHLDPMGRFVGATSARDGSAPTPASSSDARRAGCDANEEGGARQRREDAGRRETSRDKRSRAQRRASGDGDGASHASASSSAPDGTGAAADEAGGRRKRRRRETSPARAKERRRRHEARGERRRRRRRAASEDRDERDDHVSASKHGKAKRTGEMEELRRRRQAREAREAERERQVRLPPGASPWI